MKMRTLGIVAALFAVTGLAHTAAANSAGQIRSWTFQDTEFFAFDQSAVGLRSGLAWPVIFSDDDTAGLGATPGPEGSFWHPEGGGFGGDPQYPIIGKSSPDGRALVAKPGPGDDGFVFTGGSFSTPTGHGNAVAGAFDTAGNLWLADENNVFGAGSIPGGPDGDIVDLAVAPDGTIGVVTDSGSYHERRFGTWGSQGVDLAAATGGLPDPLRAASRLTFDAQNRPHVVGVDENENLHTFSFDTQQGQWARNTLGVTNATAAPIAMTAEGPFGSEVGTAWVDFDGNLNFASRDSQGNWTTNLVTDGVDFGQSVGLTYDHAGLPVISFIQNDELWLAYDPVVGSVPEPGSLILLGLATLAVAGRRGRFSGRRA